MPHDIFISHSNKDSVLADALCAALESRQIRCWIAPRDVIPGIEYAEAIINAIENCRIFLLVLSAAANTSPQTTREVERAVSKDITILPFRVENIILTKSMEYYLSQCQWLEATSRPIEPYFDKLAETISRLLTQVGGDEKPLTPIEPVIVSTKESKPNKLSASSSGPAPGIVNPFTFGNPISDPARFYGRKQEIRQIVNRLLSSARESTSIVGERRIGKTSLLNYLANPEIAAGLGLAAGKYCLVYIDFQGLTDITPQRFWQRVLAKLARISCDPALGNRCKELAERGAFDLFDLEDLFAAYADRGLHVIFFLDEFEYVTQNQKFGSDFFGGLRALAMHYPLSLVPATRRELVELCHSAELKGSPFFNIFANVVLRPFARSEAEELVDGYSRDAQIVLLPEEKEFILGLSGRNPFFLQMAGYYAIEARTQSLDAEGQRRFVASNFDLQAGPHYAYMWGHCSESERITLLTVMMLARQKPSPKSTTTLENLARLHPRAEQDIAALLKRGLLDEKEGAYLLFSSSLERWITQEITTPAGELENQSTVDDWLAQWIKRGSRDILKPFKSVLPRFKKKYWPLMGTLLGELSIKVAADAAVELVKVMM